MIRLGIVAALDREAAALGARAPSVTIEISGLGQARATTAAKALLNGGAGALMSAGVAGGLQPGLSVGSVIVAREVYAEGRPPVATDAEWRGRLCSLVDLSEAPLLTRSAPVETPADKSELFEETGAAAADMEAYAVAEVAAAAGVPFLAVKAIADDWRTRLPVELLGGGTDAWSLVAGTFRHPASAGVAVRLAMDGRKALRALRRIAAVVGPGWGF